VRTSDDGHPCMPAALLDVRECLFRRSSISAPRRPPSAAELLRAVAAARGWVVGAGLPDEARAGRLLLRDYTAGKLLHCEWPPPPFGPAPGGQAGGGAGRADGRPAAPERAQSPAQGEREEARRGAGGGGSSAEESTASSTGAAALPAWPACRL